jgi:hypothetical protein
LSEKLGSNEEMQTSNYAEAFIGPKRVLWQLPNVKKFLETSKNE